MKQRDITIFKAWATGEMSNTEVAAKLKIRSVQNVYAKMGLMIRKLVEAEIISL